MKSPRIYLTTPLYYVNAKPHLGHSYTTILVDVIKRHWVQRGNSVVALTGTDEHGEKIEQMAKASGQDPKAFCDEVSGYFRETWKQMHLDFDIFYRTTDPAHIKKVQQALTKLKDKGDIVYREYTGNYCVGCERFRTDAELTADGLCPDHQKKPEARSEANYFFLMSKYQARLIEHIEKNPSFIEPAHYRNEVLAFLKQPLEDLSISRPKTRLKWGIELPFDSNHVTYVWFDALLNYLNATGWPDSFDKPLWESVTHFTAKDILKPHGIYWPTMLMALEVPLYKTLQVHGYWLMGQSKMSKSLGNVVRPLEVEEKYGRETLRFFLLREMSFGLDSSFTLENYVTCINAYLANGIGNLVSRVLTIALKNFPGSLQLDEKTLTAEDKKALEARAKALTEWNQGFDELKYQNSMKAWGDLVTTVDLYVNETKPWALAKAAGTGDAAATARLQTVMGVCMRLIQAAAVIIYPVLPRASLDILKTLGVEFSGSCPDSKLALEDRTTFKLGSEVPKLFMRVQLPSVEA